MFAALFDRALGAGLSGANDHLQVWTALLDYLRRGIEWDEQGKTACLALQVRFTDITYSYTKCSYQDLVSFQTEFTCECLFGFASTIY